jgi:uncharacterized protein (DUF433 family)
MPAEATVVYPHITFNERGRAIVDGRFKVYMIVRDHIDGGMSPQEMHEAYEGMSLAAIHAALTYYFDHKAQMDEEMRQLAEETDKILRDLEPRNTAFWAELKRRASEKDLLP